MTSPYLAHLSAILANSGVFDKPVTVLMDGQLVPVNARVTHASVRDQVTGRKFLSETQVVKFEAASLPRWPANGDVLELPDGTAWRLYDPEDLFEGTVQCQMEQLAG